MPPLTGRGGWYRANKHSPFDGFYSIKTGNKKCPSGGVEKTSTYRP